MIPNEDVYAICCRPEVAGYVISRDNERTINEFSARNLEVASFTSFRDIKKSFRGGGGGGGEHRR